MRVIPDVVGSNNTVRTDPALWERLGACSLDDVDSALSFTQRLARDNGWSFEFARRAVDEYRRFVYLACISREPVTPSDEIDQVWHLHLAYSHHYWDEFCPDVLKKTLHHGPTKGGAAEDRRFEQQYDETLALYRAEFGTDAPSDIWPPRAIRFGLAPTYRRISVEHNAVLPRKDLANVVRIGGFGAVGVVAWVWVMSGFEYRFVLVAGVILLVGAVALAAYELLRLRRPQTRARASGGCAAACSVGGHGCGSIGGEGGSSCGGGGGGCGGGGGGD